MKKALILISAICILLSFSVSASADLDGDGDIDLQDLIIVASNFGKTQFDTKADTNNDGIVDIYDVVYVASRIGTTPPPQTCYDGTPYNQCSNTKPMYCNNGTLIQKCTTCGCPTGQNCTANNTCITPPACTPTTEICGNGIDEDCDGYDLACSGRSLYVSTSGSDSYNGLYPTYQGGTNGPFKTVQKAITASIEEDTINIAAGTYDLAGYSSSLNKAISIIGQSRDTTILTNGGTLSLHKKISAKNIMFKNYVKKDYNSAVFFMAPSSGEVIDGLSIDSCAFDNVPGVLISRNIAGTMRNIVVSNNLITNVNSNGATSVIAIYDGIINNINVSHNTIKNVHAIPSTSDVIVIIFGRDETTVVDGITVADNVIETIRGGTTPTSGYYPGGRGILAYGTNIKVLNNYVSDVDQADGFPRNCIYIKASDSIISGNVAHNCGSQTAGSGSGDITIKGNNNENNRVTGNRITSDSNQVLGGFGIFTKGEVTIEDNYIDKPHGIGTWSYEATGRVLLISKNYIKTGEQAVWSYGDGILGTVRDNTLISYNTEPTRLPSYFTLINNQLCQGTDCNITPQVKTCINQGYYCCNSCAGTAYSSYDSTCQYGRGKCCTACS